MVKIIASPLASIGLFFLILEDISNTVKLTDSLCKEIVSPHASMRFKREKKCSIWHFKHLSSTEVYPGSMDGRTVAL